MSPRDTKPLKDRANDSRNHILNNLVNGLAKESNNEDGKNIINKGKAKNNNNRSNNSNNMDDDNSNNSNSSNNNKADEACRYIKRQGLLTPITS